MTLRKTIIIYNILLAVALVCAFIGTVTEVFAFSMIGAILALIAMIIQTIFYRCPVCGRFLRHHRVKYCPHCGEELDT